MITAALASNLEAVAWDGSGQAADAQPSTPREPFTWTPSGLVFSFEFLDNRLRSRILLPTGAHAPSDLPAPTAISGLETALHCTGEDINEHHGMKLTGGEPGNRLVFVGKQETPTANGSRLVLTHADPVLGLQVESIYEAYHDVPVVRRYARVTNKGKAPVGIEYLSSALLHNFSSPRAFEKDLRVHYCMNSWQTEGQWRAAKPSEIGFVDNGNFSVSAAFFNSIGTWSTARYLPMGMVENKDLKVIWFWQIEHNGSWHWELSDTSDKMVYAYIGGPDALHAQAWKNLQPGESYQTVPAGVGCVQGGFDEAVAALTAYRRAACIRPRMDTEKLPVIFNDYMNCLEGDPTTEKELPLIDAAAAAGCEYFIIDAGWYAERQENWWGSVGAWQPSKTRFPGGLQQVLDHIRDKGMISGLWLEPEVVGIHSPLASKPDAWFFQRHGKRVIDHSRYLLDFRNPEVRAYLDSVVDRLVGQYGIGYIKMDYNVDGLEGTELHADSFGQGLLEHNRALLAWLDTVLSRYPKLTIENCSSGGGRMEYAMLSHLQLQSSSDQTDYRLYPAIAVGSSAGVLPEQLAVWSYPMQNDMADAASFNMVNAMLFRIHQSGHLAKLTAPSLQQVKAGIRVYKETIRPHIRQAVPFYPLGLPDIVDRVSPIAIGMRGPGKHFVAVWRLSGPAEVQVPGIGSSYQLLYPTDLDIGATASGDGVRIVFPRENMACILQSS